MVQGRGKKVRHTRNILKNMEKHTEGPLAFLATIKTDRKRIKVNIST